MDFSVPSETQELSDQVREFVQRELIPLETEMAYKSFRQLLPELQSKRELVRRLGLWTPQIPTECGGVGLGFLDYAVVSEQLGRSPFGHFVFNAQAPDAGNMEILIEFGSDQQKRVWLEPLLRGRNSQLFLDDGKRPARFESSLDGNNRCS